ncbi:MAG TPA: bifunctional demethylmenaquinone methyltransferase/2-methoxy-6-polyprenyl-1,4-benzoquinol methylase UbiE [Parafilimonas sp.]|nr:bifunctional demethylmenaquinone methyltransferase/2-methoxy-6-polyprenyl-1,4-benzoquinol methylase UbiE [Parafilimonas sp.]
MAMYAHDEIVPDKQSALNKKSQVAKMFDDISGSYDFLNRFLSAGIDKGWRRKAIKELKNVHPKFILDVATGTGDVAILTYKILKPEKITGIDISDGMLELGRKKIDKLNLSSKIELMHGDSETLNFNANYFDAITVAFGVRNFEHLEKGLLEMLKVLKPGGKVAILEFSKPKTFLFKGFYNLYMKIVAPGFGKMIAKNKQAYEYLNNSVQAFPDRNAFLSIMQQVGFKQTYFKQLTFGICCIYCGYK